MHCWYVLRSKPHKEAALYREVTARGYEAYYPTLRVTPKNPRANRRQSFFPGYMFVNYDLEDVGISTFRWMPYSVGLVCFGGEAAVVQPALIQSIRQHVEALNNGSLNSVSKFKQGDRLQITNGPFTGFGAIFDKTLTNHGRVRVLLEFLSGQYASLELDQSSLESVSLFDA
jgi:transcription antitermination factor NusG